MLGLARSDAGAQRLATMGAEVHRGALDDLESLRDGARKADAVIHTAFNHDFSKFLENCAEDRRAIEAMGAVLEGSARPMLVTSGFGSLAPGRLATEADGPPPVSRAPPRPRPPPSRHGACAHRPCVWRHRPMARAITVSSRA